jgi:hypothetical protein
MREQIYMTMHSKSMRPYKLSLQKQGDIATAGYYINELSGVKIYMSEILKFSWQ